MSTIPQSRLPRFVQPVFEKRRSFLETRCARNFSVSSRLLNYSPLFLPGTRFQATTIRILDGVLFDLTLCICDTPSCLLHDNQNYLLFSALVLIVLMFDSSVSDVFFFFFFFFFPFALRSGGTALCYVSFLLSCIYVMKTGLPHGMWRI